MTFLLNRKLETVLSVAFFALTFSGCADPLKYENFSQIREDATMDWEVQKLIGDPSQKLDNQWLYERPDKHLTALVDFNRDGRVVRKQWIDAMNNVWEDSEEPDPNRNSQQRIEVQSRKD